MVKTDRLWSCGFWSRSSSVLEFADLTLAKVLNVLESVLIEPARPLDDGEQLVRVKVSPEVM